VTSGADKQESSMKHILSTDALMNIAIIIGISLIKLYPYLDMFILLMVLGQWHLFSVIEMLQGLIIKITNT
jgi:hypothetical protein